MAKEVYIIIAVTENNVEHIKEVFTNKAKAVKCLKEFPSQLKNSVWKEAHIKTREITN